MYDFVERVNLQILNKKNLDCLAMAGAFDNISGWSRSRFFMVAEGGKDEGTFLEHLMRYGQRMQIERNSSQQSLFGGATAADVQKPEIPKGPEWTKLEMLNREKDVVGIYLSSHPLDEYKIIIRNFCNMPVSDLEELEHLRKKDFVVGGMVTQVNNLMTKTGKPFGRFTIEDYNGSYTFSLFGKDYENFRKYLYPDYYLMIRGKVMPKPYNDNDLEPKISSIMQLEEAQNTLVKEMVLTLPVDEITDDMIADIAAHLRAAEGNIQLRMRVIDPENSVSLGMFSRTIRVSLSGELIKYCEDSGIRYSLN
jgi:DNA polymerase-3 subunit alpha